MPRPRDDGDSRILKYRPRTSETAPGASPQAAPVPAEPDDYRRRMTINLAAAAFTLALTAFGIWLAVRIADLRSTQDCVLMGRRDCAHLADRPR